MGKRRSLPAAVVSVLLGVCLLAAAGPAHAVSSAAARTWNVYVFAGVPGHVRSGDNCAFGSSQSGPATSEGFAYPWWLTVDSSGDLFVDNDCDGQVDIVAARDCAIDCQFGLSTTTAGYLYSLLPGYPEYEVGPIAADGDRGLVMAADGLYFFSSGSCSRACPFGLPTTKPATEYGIAAQNPAAVAVDPHGDALAADEDQNVVQLVAAATCSSRCPFGLASTVAGNAYTIAGDGSAGETGDGRPATRAAVGAPSAIAVDSEGDLIIASAANHVLRFVAAGSCRTECAFGRPTTAGDVYTIAGGGPLVRWGGVLATQTWLVDPGGLAVDHQGNVLVSEADRLQVVMARDCSANCPYGLASARAGYLYTVAGDGSGGFNDLAVSTKVARLASPQGLAVDAAGNVLVADSGQDSVLIVAPAAAATARTALTLTSSANPGRVGKWVTYIATVDPDATSRPATGFVDFLDNGSPAKCEGRHAGWLSATTPDEAVCEVRYRVAGPHAISASYTGDWRFAASKASLSEQIVT